MGASVVFGITCVALPVLAWLVINQSWELYIPFVRVVFKPWRLFLIVCGLPSLLCAIAMIPVPESPKYVLGQGEQFECVRILERMHRWNVSKHEPPLRIADGIAEEDESAERRERSAAERAHGSGGAASHLLKSMWQQTATLFSQANWRRTCIACTMQFGILVSSNGMYMWFPDILNRTADFVTNHPGERRGLCEILTGATMSDSFVASDGIIGNATTAAAVCTTQLELETYEHSIVLELLYAFGFAFIGVIINRISKCVILCELGGGALWLPRDLMLPRIGNICLRILFSLVGVLIFCGICGIAAVFVPYPMLAIYLYVILLLCGLAVPVVNAATVDLYPTNSR